MFPSLKLKLSILFYFTFVIGAYFSIKVLEYLMELFLSDEVALEKFFTGV